MHRYWKSFLTQSNQWIPVLLLFPLLYLFGWLCVQPLSIFFPGLIKEQISLLGTIVSFFLLIYIIPGWVKYRWRVTRPWEALGVIYSKKIRSLIFFVKGFLLAIFLLLILVGLIVLDSSGTWINGFNFKYLFNAIVLGLGVGFAEELIFRSLLFREFNNFFGVKLGLIVQALIFSLSHTRFDLGFLTLSFLISGLFLLGIVLGLMRLLDHGSILGCIGLHGGLISGWFLISNCFVEINPDAPFWLLGPSIVNPNPISGLISMFLLIILLMFQLKALAIAGRP